MMPTIIIKKPRSLAEKKLKRQGIVLKTHQKTAIKWMAEKERSQAPYGGIITDEMGLGKTLEVIGLLLESPKEKTLIIVPSSLIAQWKSEFAKFAPKLHISSDRRECESCSIFITSYAMACTNNKLYDQITWDRLILDEAHYIRNAKCKTFKRLKELRAEHKWCLTGTPIHNGWGDIASLFSLVGFDYDKNVKIIIPRVETHVLHRTKNEVDIVLPKIINETIDIPIGKDGEMYSRVTQYHPIHMVRLLRSRQFAIMPKMAITNMKDESNPSNPKLDSLIKSLADSQTTEKPIVFCHFREEMAYLEMGLAKNGIICGVIHGGVAMHTRRPLIDRHETYHVLLIQLQAGSVGLNLQMFDTVYFTGPHWNPTHEQQAIARVHRIGQTKTVTVKKFIMDKTIENRIVDVQNHKIQKAEEIYTRIED
jgi:SNF2 family DNA or RNA helicase